MRYYQLKFQYYNVVKLVILYQFPFFRIVHDTICLEGEGGVGGEQIVHKWHRHIIDY